MKLTAAEFRRRRSCDGDARDARSWMLSPAAWPTVSEQRHALHWFPHEGLVRGSRDGLLRQAGAGIGYLGLGAEQPVNQNTSPPRDLPGASHRDLVTRRQKAQRAAARAAAAARRLPRGYIDPADADDPSLAWRPMRIVERRPPRPDADVLETFKRFLAGFASVADINAAIDVALAAEVSWAGFEHERVCLVRYRCYRTMEHWEVVRTHTLRLGMRPDDGINLQL